MAALTQTFNFNGPLNLMLARTLMNFYGILGCAAVGTDAEVEIKCSMVDNDSSFDADFKFIQKISHHSKIFGPTDYKTYFETLLKIKQLFTLGLNCLAKVIYRWMSSSVYTRSTEDSCRLCRSTILRAMA